MNINILQKCVAELQKDTFSKEYVLGMLETLIEVNKLPTETMEARGAPIAAVPHAIEFNKMISEPAPIKTDEELFLEQYERGING